TPVLVLPGYGDSGPGHWQSRWQAADPTHRRVVQRDWLNPTLDEWRETLEHAVAGCDRPPVLVAHSLACALVAHWARGTRRRVAHDLFLVRLERRQDVVRHVRLVLRSADADLHAADRIGAERLDDGLHAVVTAGAALEPRADLAQLHVDVVVDEDEILGPRVERAAHASHGGPADIHERLGLDEIERVAAPRAACDQ